VWIRGVSDDLWNNSCFVFVKSKDNFLGVILFVVKFIFSFGASALDYLFLLDFEEALS
jgi:hypothetical protein